MSHLNFFILACSTNFVLLKMTCLVTLFDSKHQIFKYSSKLPIFGLFYELLFTVNVARFARNLEWDFSCDFQTLWIVELGGSGCQNLTCKRITLRTSSQTAKVKTQVKQSSWGFNCCSNDDDFCNARHDSCAVNHCNFMPDGRWRLPSEPSYPVSLSTKNKIQFKNWHTKLFFTKQKSLLILHKIFCTVLQKICAVLVCIIFSLLFSTNCIQQASQALKF